MTREIRFVERNRVWWADFLLLLVAVVWGAAFVAQRAAMAHLGPIAYNGIRFLLGALALVPLARHRARSGRDEASRGVAAPGGYLRAGLSAGTCLATAAALQQIGLVHTTAGKAGFITGLYVVMVPLLGLIGGERPHGLTWAGIGLATGGLYLLSVTESWTLAPGDLLELIGAGFWAIHVILVGRFARRLEPVAFAASQFAVCGLLSLGVAAVWETPTLAGVTAAWGPILYGGLVSVGIGYTLQVVAQQDTPATHAAIILSLEAVFAALTGWLLLAETMDGRALTGCALMLTGCLLPHLAPAPPTSPGPEPLALTDPGKEVSTSA